MRRLTTRYNIHQLTRHDQALMKALLATFGDAFGEAETYGGNQPSAGYLEQLLGTDYFIALAALKDGAVVGGCTRSWVSARTYCISIWR